MIPTLLLLSAALLVVVAVLFFRLKGVHRSLAEREELLAHYQSETERIHRETTDAIARIQAEVEPLRKYQGIHDAEAIATRKLHESEVAAAERILLARTEAERIEAEARTSAEREREILNEERQEGLRRTRESRANAEMILKRATEDAGGIVRAAQAEAQRIAGTAYTALTEKEHLEQAARAIRNVIEGYGDRYVVPSRSVLDDLAEEYGSAEAGRELKRAREHSVRMVEAGEAATCGYVEDKRRGSAIRFVVDAFNGRADAILSRVRSDNVGTLQQELLDAFGLVNLNGEAFRNASILPAYYHARSAELKWAVAAQQLKEQEREEQRRIKEQIREEEKARRDYERAIKEAEQEEETIRKTLMKARVEMEKVASEERGKFEARIAELSTQLAEAEAKNQRAISMAQKTRAGHVYVISNLGSFGEDVFKIGMTRRLEPLDRIKELGDASVPFEFDVHAMIYSDDAPTLEHLLHTEFDDHRINKVNFRKEYFRMPLERIQELVAAQGLEVSFTILAEAREWRETQSVERMSPEERAKYYAQHDAEDIPSDN
jgi:hypothetical protein